MKQFGKWIIIGSVIALAGSFFMKEKTSEFTRFIPGLSDKTSTFVQPDGSAG